MRDADASLVARMRAGEEAACREFVDAHRDRIITLVARVSGSPADAEDLAQEAFLKAFAALDRFEGGSALFTWLYRIAVNVAHDFRAHRRRRPVVSIDGPEGPIVDAVDDGGEPPDARLARSERAAAVHSALERLPEPFRTTLVLRELQGHTYEEIATLLRVSIGTVESRIFRARCKLRDLLGDVEP